MLSTSASVQGQAAAYTCPPRSEKTHPQKWTPNRLIIWQGNTRTHP